jgi:RNA polymerase sigma factor (sigma-70 family)
VKDNGREFESFARPHTAAALQLARALVHDETDAQDVLQDSFLRAFRHFKTFEGENPRAWLLSIVRNVCFTLWRKRTHGLIDLDAGDATDLAEAEPDPTPSVEAQLLQATDAGEVRAALGRLPVTYREVLVLREMEDCSYREIASILEVPIGTVMSRLSRARALLVRELVPAVERSRN